MVLGNLPETEGRVGLGGREFHSGCNQTLGALESSEQVPPMK